MSDDDKNSGLALDEVNRETVRRALNVLTEAPYFYREDDPVLFQDLRRRRAAFEDFFKRYFGWDLIVDTRCARLLKRGRENPALRDSEHDAFRLTRRNQCLVFALLLEYFELEGRRTNWDVERDPPLRFFHNEFYEHTRRRFRELLGDRAPDDAALRREIQDTWNTLKHYRFIRYIPPTPAEANEEPAREGELYEFLPAIYFYDTRTLSDPAWIERLNTLDKNEDSSDDMDFVPAEDNSSD